MSSEPATRLRNKGTRAQKLVGHLAGECEHPTAQLSGGADAYRNAITDVSAWLATLDHGARPALRALGELLLGVAERDTSPDTAEKFTGRCLGVADCALIVDGERRLNPVSRMAIAVELAEWVAEHSDTCEIGRVTSLACSCGRQRSQRENPSARRLIASTAAAQRFHG